MPSHEPDAARPNGTCMLASGRSTTRRSSRRWTRGATDVAVRPARATANPLEPILAELRGLRATGAGSDQAVRHRHQRPHRTRSYFPQRRRLARGRCWRRPACPWCSRRSRSTARPTGTAVIPATPRIHPLIYHCDSRDIVLVQINPIQRPVPPRTAREILDRLNEIAFNAALIEELRIDCAAAAGGRSWHWRRRRACEDAPAPDFQRRDALARLLVEDAGGVEVSFVMLRDAGREAAAAFLQGHGEDLGVRSSLDLDEFLEGV